MVKESEGKTPYNKSKDRKSGQNNGGSKNHTQNKKDLSYITSDEFVAKIKREIEELEKRIEKKRNIRIKKDLEFAKKNNIEESGNENTNPVHTKGKGYTYKEDAGKSAQWKNNNKDSKTDSEEKFNNKNDSDSSKKESEEKDPYIESLKRRINEINQKVSDLNISLEHKKLTPRERISLENEIRTLSEEQRQLIAELKNYKRRNRDSRNTKSQDRTRRDPPREAPNNGAENRRTNKNAYDILNEIREKYATAYNDFYKNREKKLGRINKIKRGIGINIEDKIPVPEDLKDLEEKYSNSLYEYGNFLLSEKEKELHIAGIFGDEFEREIKSYISGELKLKILDEEQKKRESLYIENLPKKEKSVLGKFGAWYGKQNKFTRKAISILAFTGASSVILSMSGAGATAVAGFAGVKILRSGIGAVAGESAAGILGYFGKKKIDTQQSINQFDIQKEFSNNGWNKESFDKAKDMYQKSLDDKLKKMKSLRKKQILAKILIGGGTVYGLGFMDAFADHSFSKTFNKENISAENNAAEIEYKTKEYENPDSEIKNIKTNFQELKVEVNSRGAIATIEDLKNKLKNLYPDQSNTPKNIKYILNTNSISLTQEWGMFNPEDASGKESAWMLKGSNITVDENGKVTLHNLGKGDTILSGEGSEKYNGEMFDSDGNAKEKLDTSTGVEDEGNADSETYPSDDELKNYDEYGNEIEKEIKPTNDNIIENIDDQKIKREEPFKVIPIDEAFPNKSTSSNPEIIEDTKNVPKTENAEQILEAKENLKFKRYINEIFGRRFFGTPISNGTNTEEWAYLKNAKIEIEADDSIKLKNDSGEILTEGSQDDIYQNSGGGRIDKIADRLEEFIKNQNIKPNTEESIENYLKRVAKTKV